MILKYPSFRASGAKNKLTKSEINHEQYGPIVFWWEGKKIFSHKKMTKSSWLNIITWEGAMPQFTKILNENVSQMR